MIWLLLALLLLPLPASASTLWGVGPCLMPASAGSVNDALAIASLTPCQLGFTPLGSGSVSASGTLTNHAPILGSGSALVRAGGLGATNQVWQGVTGLDPVWTDGPSVTTVFTNGSFGLVLNPFGVGSGQTGGVAWRELAANGTNFLGFKAPDSLATSLTYTLPQPPIGSGLILSTDFAGVLTWIAPGAGTVSGSGTTNTIPKWSAATALTDSLATDDGTTLTYSGTGGIAAAGAGPGILELREGAAPAVSASGFDVIYGDSSSHSLKCSFNGGAYTDCFSANTVTAAGTLTANAFVIGGGAKAVSAVAITGLVLGAGASTPGPYGGTTCGAGQFVNALNASGASTCATPAGSGGNVNASATLTNGQLITGLGSTNVQTLANGAGVLHAGTPPTWASVSLVNEVTGRVQATNFPALTGDITTPGGSLATTLSLTGVAAGTYNSVTVDTKGRVTAGSSSGSTTGIQTSTFAGLPAPGTVGAARYVTDTIRGLFFDNGTAWVPQGATSPAVRYLSVVTDASLASAVSQLPSTGGTIVIPAGTFAMSAGTITIPIPVVIQCQGGAGTILTNFGGFSFTGATTAGRVGVLDCGLALAAGKTGIRVTSPSAIFGSIFSRNIITGGAIAIATVSNAVNNTITDNFLKTQTTYNVDLQNAANPDQGDNVVANNQLECNCTASIHVTAGGLRVTGNKSIGDPQFNIQAVTSASGGLQVVGNDLTTATTASISVVGSYSGVDISGNGFEPRNGTMIILDATGGGASIARGAISGNHFRPSNTGTGIDIRGNTQNISIVGNEFFGVSGANFISAGGSQTTIFVGQNQWIAAGTAPFVGTAMGLTDNIGLPLAQLLAWNDGSVVFCADCLAGSDPCTAGNSGAIAKRYNDNGGGSAWHCQK